MKTNRILILAFFLPFLISCSDESSSIGDDSKVNTEDNSSSENEQNLSGKELVLKLVNEQRAKGCNCGNNYMPPVSPLTLNPKLTKAAQMHSEDMNKHKKLTHTGSNGSKFSARITANGYKWSNCAENISSRGTAEKSMKGWMKSPGHCKNIMSGDYKEIGIGNSGIYWTQVFGTHR